MSRRGIADVDVHIHHDGEGEQKLRGPDDPFIETLAGRHGLLRKYGGRTVFAEDAVAPVKDPELKRIAFEKIQDSLLAKGAPGTPARSLKSERQTRPHKSDRRPGEQRALGTEGLSRTWESRPPHTDRATFDAHAKAVPVPPKSPLVPCSSPSACSALKAPPSSIPIRAASRAA